MATKDISRYLYQPAKRYAAARLQQGRLLFDYDFNEGVELEEEDRKGTLVRLFGPSASSDQGFMIGTAPRQIFNGRYVSTKLRLGHAAPVQQVVLNGLGTNVHAVGILPGSFYLGGMRFELGEAEHIAFQRGFLQMRVGDLPALEASPSPSPFSPSSPDSPQFLEFRYLYYLNGWEQVVTPVEDDELLERALLGVDTTVRVCRLRRVEVVSVPPGTGDGCGEAWDAVVEALEADNAELDRRSGELRSKGRFGLTFETLPEGECEPCTPDPGAEYLGTEDQTLRVMLTSATTFVWGFDSAASLYRVRVTGLDQTNPQEVRVELLNPPKDEEHQPKRHRVLEILPFAALLEDGENERIGDPHFLKVAAEVGVFTRVADDYDAETRSLTIDTEVGLAALAELVYRWDSKHPAAAQLNLSEANSDARFFYARFWHVAESVAEVELPISSDPGAASLGDTGLVPIFHQPGRRGDYWIATLRTEARDRVVPFDLLTTPGGVAPHGPRHFYAPLSLVDGENLTVADVDVCRPVLRPVTDRGCATYTVGDGLLSAGDFQNLQAAVEALPAEGGLISVLPGIHRSSLNIQGRTGVVIEGCGDATVIEAFETAPTAPLLSFQGCSGLTLSNLKIHTGEQVGVKLQNCSNVTLQRLTVMAGVITSAGPPPVFVTQPGASDLPLIEVIGTLQVVGGQPDEDSRPASLNFSALTLESQRRPGLLVTTYRDVTLSDLRCAGAPHSATTLGPPAGPMISLLDVKNGRVRDCALETFAQAGVAIVGDGTTDLAVQLTSLSINAGSFSEPAGTSTQQHEAVSGVDIDGGVNVSLERSHIVFEDAFSEHATVVVSGVDITIEDNHLEGLGGGAWGGIQVRGGSRKVELRNNRIKGGFGHGVTLGSVTWVLESAPATGERRGAGADQLGVADEVTGLFPGFEAVNDRDLWPQSEGVLRDIVLADNRIEGMGCNGVSMLAVLGLRTITFSAGSPVFGAIQPMTVERLVIERNMIVSNVQSPVADRQMLTRSPFPGDAPGGLATQVPAGGYLPLTVLPQGGIVLGLATGADIRENVVLSNGNATTTPVTGVFLLGGDTVNISGNRISDNGAPAAADMAPDTGVRGGVVVILAGSTDAGATPPSLQGLDDLIESPTQATALGSSTVALQVLNNTISQPEGRALHAVALGPVVVDGNFLASHGHHHVQATAGFADVVFVLDLAAPWEKRDLPALTTFQVPNGTATYLARSFNGLGGQILFNNNQVTYDWKQVDLGGSPGNNASFCPVALMTRDHLTLSSNQFALRLDTFSGGDGGVGGVISQRIGVHVFAVGGTVNAIRNRFSEAVNSTFASLFSVGRLLNMTTYNQGTHPVAAELWDDQGSSTGRYLLDKSNQVMFRRVASPPDVSSELFDALGDFFKFVWEAAP